MKTALFMLMLFLADCFIQSDFLTEQKKFERVRTAFREKEMPVKEMLQNAGLDAGNLNIIITAYKSEKKLNIYAKRKEDRAYKKVAVYDICSSSGSLGPKRMQGDLQVPEGFYHIDRFNPTSNFYLSLGINYPNASDRKQSKASKLGGDIFIHGECITIGCLPMTTDKMKEIYVYAVQARQCGQQKIPVYIFPFRMTDQNLEKFRDQYKGYPELAKFWDNLKAGHDRFPSDFRELNISVGITGDYIFN